MQKFFVPAGREIGYSVFASKSGKFATFTLDGAFADAGLIEELIAAI
jgi:hypothetical protein